MTTRGVMHKVAASAVLVLACTGPSAGDREKALVDALRKHFGAGDETVLAESQRDRNERPPLAHHSSAAVDVSVPDKANGETRIVDRATGTSIAFSLLGTRGARAAKVGGVDVFEGGGPESSHVLVRRTASGVEDFLAFEKSAKHRSLRYVVDVTKVAGLRLIENVLEFLDFGGTPRLRMDAPAFVDARGSAENARVVLEDCAADRDPRAPWGRAVTSPGLPQCVVRVEWDQSGDALAYPVLVDPVWTATANTMTAARAGHTATLLGNGKVLIVGGQHPSGTTATYLNSTELFDPATNTFAAGAPLTGPRSFHTALRLSNGDVLVAGGANSAGALTTTEIYGAATQKFRSGGALKAARQEALATKLDSGKVLITGGISGTTVLRTAELYDATAGTWTFTTGDMAIPRFGHYLTTLPLGQAFVVGGAAVPAGSLVVNTVDYYTESTDAFSAAPTLATARYHFGAVTLADARVLVVSGATSSTAETPTAEIFDPNVGAWSPAGSLTHARTRHRVALVGGGVAIATGGIEGTAKTVLRSVEVFDAAAKKWSALADMLQPRYDHTATTLADGRVLVAGGNTSATAVTATAETLSLDKNGAACTSGSTCVSKQCVDGVCCESDCTTACFGCSKATTGLADGVCGAALAGKDPHGDCSDDGAPGCGNDGFCDGSGACEKYPAKPCTPSPCKAAGDCTSGHCVDGVCCDGACSGICEACTAAKKGTGTSGTCGPIAAATDPDKECGQMGSASCQGDATCDGSGACRVPNAGKACAQAKCSDAVTLAEAATCSPAGECTAVKTTCSPYACDTAAAACKTTCSTAADCAPGGTCLSGACNLKDNGATCSRDGECTSNDCVDGFCCDTPCTDECAACDVSGSEGKCSPATGVPHGNRKACTGSAPCVGTCNGHLTTECTYPNNTSCGSTVGCSDGGETAQRCNGFGDCVELPTKTCAPFVCGAGECKTSCETDSDCAFGYTCHPKSGCVLANQPACVDGSDRGCPSPAAAPGDEGGCGCRVGAARRDYGGLLGAMLLGGAWLSRRKRR